MIGRGIGIQQMRRLATTSCSRLERKLWRVDKNNPFLEIPEAWVTNLAEVNATSRFIVKLHPDVFRVPPRLDLLHRNVTWQKNYRNLTMTKMLSKAEMPGPRGKPWPQKRQGRHHAGSIRSPHFIEGGFAHGVRGPLTKFSMLPDSIRLDGLCTALTVKHAQDDLVLIDDFSSLSDSNPQFLHDMADSRNWGYSVLFVDTAFKEMDQKLVDATSKIPSFNLIPLYGLNCYSIVKHDTLVLSLRALDAVEDKILNLMHRSGDANRPYRYIDYKERILGEGEDEEDPHFPPSLCPPTV